MTTYAEFRIRIERGTSRRTYRVEASGLGGEDEGRFRLPFTDTELENFVLKIGRTRRGVRRIDSPEMELARSFGGDLFSAVMDGKIGELYRATLAEARAAGQGLRVTLSLTDVPELGAIPWEYLYDSPGFLSISPWTPVVRYLDLPRPRRALEVKLPLRILGIVSAPTDAVTLDTDIERRKLEAALAPLVQAGAVSIDWLEEANLLALARKVRTDSYHIIHFIGHGGFDDSSGEGALLFQDEIGRGQLVSGDQLATILNGKVMLRLVLLNSCEGARNSVTDPFSGVAASLVQREIPAVIGMQFEITDRAAILFAGEFYSMLAEGQPVDAAMTEARLAIFADHNDVEWATPVLFMRVSDGRLFDIADAAALPRLAPEDVPTIVAPVVADEVPHAPTMDPGPTEPPAVVAQPKPEGEPRAAAVTGTIAGEGVAVEAEPDVAPPDAQAPARLSLQGADPYSISTLDYERTMPVSASPPSASRRLWPIAAVGLLVVLLSVVAIYGLMSSGSGSGTGSVHADVNGARETGRIIVTGTDFKAGETVDILLKDSLASSEATLVGSALVGANGSFSTTIPIGSSTSGTVFVEGQSSGHKANDDYSIRTFLGSPTPATSAAQSNPGGSGLPTPLGSEQPSPFAGGSPSAAAGSQDILFHSDLAGGNNQLYAIDPVSKRILRLTNSGAQDMNPTWSPDRRRIAFARGQDIYICTPVTTEPSDGWCDGTAARSLTTGFDDEFPAWSSTDWIAFVRRGPPDSIWKVKPGGSGLTHLLPGTLLGAPPLLRAPAWSPDGTNLALFGGQSSSNYDLLFVRADGTGTLGRYTDRDVSELNPSWSPDGSQIVFVRDVGTSGCANHDLWLLDSKTRMLAGPLVTGNGRQDGNPVWSIDGSQIAFYRATKADCRDNTGYRLWVIDSKGTTAPRELMPERAGRNLDPNWR